MYHYEVKYLNKSGHYYNGKYHIGLEKEATKCPICHAAIKAFYISGFVDEATNMAHLLFECRNCNNGFIETISHIKDSGGIYSAFVFTKNSVVSISPQKPVEVEFAECINNISSQFVEIYNQASAAETYGLNEVAGVGYRKAFEFLIKDYCCNGKTEEEQEKIKNKFLGNIIREDIDNINLKKIAEKAVWLGNDETHYLKRWNKEIEVLKRCIEISVTHVANDLDTAALLADMSDNKT